MFEGFKDVSILLGNNITIAGKQGGSGSPLLLLHGFPQSHHIWHKVSGELAKRYTVVALDLRGYGASSKPAGDAKHSQYAKSAMAKDMKDAMSKLGHECFFLCAHDRGARVGQKLCIDYPNSVKKAIFLDICPTLAMYSQTNQAFATAYFHWFFLIQRSPFPEETISQNPRLFAERFMGARHAGLTAFHPDNFDYYVKVMGKADAIHGMCEDYRASAEIDLEEAKKDIEEGRMIMCPLKVLWGEHGVIEKMFSAVKEWKEISKSSVEGHSVPSGHYIPEEVPELLLKEIEDFMI